MRPVRTKLLLAAVGLLLLLLALPTPEGLTPPGQRALAVMSFCIVLWASGAIALSITALLGLALLPLLGVLPPSEAFALFGNQAVFFVLGVFIMSAVLMKTGLSLRMALLLLRAFSGSPDRLALGVLLLSTGFTFIVLSHAVAAMLFPILLEVARALHLSREDSPYARRLFLSLAWGTIVGSNATLLGAARHSLALGFLDQYLRFHGLPPVTITFFQWIVSIFPLPIVLTIIVYWVLKLGFRSEQVSLEPALLLVERKVREMGPMSRAERVTAATLTAMVLSMMFWGQRFGLGTLALLYSSLLFALGVLRWEDAEKYVNWGIVLLFGGAVAIGAAVERTGAVAWLLDALVPREGISALLLIAVISLLSAFMTEFVSNSAVITFLVPVALSLCGRLGIDPRLMVLSISVPAGHAFMLPTGTPAMALVFSSGYLRPRDTLLSGLSLVVLSWALFLVIVVLWWPRVGLTLGGR